MYWQLCACLRSSVCLCRRFYVSVAVVLAVVMNSSVALLACVCLLVFVLFVCVV